MITAILIEDDPRHAATLQMRLTQTTTRVNLLAVCTNVHDAFIAINQHQPNLLFLDIELEGHETGFDLLKQFNNPAFSVIFTTQYSTANNAINAIRASALDFLSKPLLLEELEDALARVNIQEGPAQIQSLKDNIGAADGKLKSIWLSDTKGRTPVEVANIIYCESDDKYTTFYFATPVVGKTNFITSVGIKEWEKRLANSNIIRTHREYLLNLKYMARFSQSKFLLTNGFEIPVSKSRKPAVKTRLEQFLKGR